MYEKYLRGSGYQVIAVRTITEARQALSEFKPAAVVLDVLLEGESSWPLLAELKRREETKDIPVIVATVVEGRETALALGADEFFFKPVEKRWLLEKLRALARREPVETILVIDDDAASRYLLRGYLQGTNYSLVEAEDGQEGLKRAEEVKPQVIFLDLILPDLTAFEVLEALRRAPATAQTPIIINTVKELEEEERRRLAAVTAAIVSKNAPSREAAVARIREALLLARAASPRSG
jgi:CheY-like chemotaxis protein